jgi:hypothetical protein
MGQRLHRLNILKTLFHDFAGNIEWGGEDYNNTSLFDVLNLVEGSDTESTNKSGMAAGQEVEGSM